jgi:ABC-2 type transport system permease protein
VNLVRSELLKIRTVNVWWIFTVCAVLLQAASFLVNAVEAHYAFSEGFNPGDVPPDQAATVAAAFAPANQAAGLYTSGQYFGLLFVLLLGIMIVTGEFQHQTATTTFLTTPHRTAVVLAKLATAALAGAALWVLSTVLNLVAGAIFLATQHVDSYLTDGNVLRAIALNLLAYVLWAIFGVGFGVLLRNQIAAVVTAVILYVAGQAASQLIFSLLQMWLHWDWVEKVQVIVPSIASQLMITGVDLPGRPPQWVGAAVLIAYAIVTSVIGTAIMRRRDIS